MLRRNLLRAAPAALALAAGPAAAQPRPPSAAELEARGRAAREAIRAGMEERRRRLAELRDHLRSLLDNLPLLERTRGFRELEFRNPGLTGLASLAPRPGVMPAGFRGPSLLPGMSPAGKPLLQLAAATPPAASSLPIAQEAKDLIIEFEVSSPSIYTRQYQAPVWPGGNSGVTVGIGFDLGYCSAGAFAKYWSGILTDSQSAVLAPLCQLKADKAHQQVGEPTIKALRVTWDQAYAQFDRFLPLTVGETAGAFANCDGLPPESLGALVSLVYNRGSSLSSDPRRAEMVNISKLMAAKDYAGVPAQIRAMKRLWQDLPGAEGLLERRELEAKLFEAGLAG